MQFALSTYLSFLFYITWSGNEKLAVKHFILLCSSLASLSLIVSEI